MAKKHTHPDWNQCEGYKLKTVHIGKEKLPILTSTGIRCRNKTKSKHKYCALHQQYADTEDLISGQMNRYIPISTKQAKEVFSGRSTAQKIQDLRHTSPVTFQKPTEFWLTNMGLSDVKGIDTKNKRRLKQLQKTTKKSQRKQTSQKQTKKTKKKK